MPFLSAHHFAAAVVVIAVAWAAVDDCPKTTSKCIRWRFELQTRTLVVSKWTHYTVALYEHAHFSDNLALNKRCNVVILLSAKLQRESFERVRKSCVEWARDRKSQYQFLLYIFFFRLFMICRVDFHFEFVWCVCTFMFITHGKT